MPNITTAPILINARIMPNPNANWYTPEGVNKKYKQLKAKGLPDFTHWRFITLTIDQHFVSDPKEAYLKGNQEMRRYLERLRKWLDSRGQRWCWKLEFHENGYPHWHLLFELKEKIPECLLNEFCSIWRLGRCNVKCVSQSELDYMFKYVTKESFSDSGGLALPEWVCDWEHNFRFFQTSRNFYEKTVSRPKAPKSDNPQKKPVMSIRQKFEANLKRAKILYEGTDGKIKGLLNFSFNRSFLEVYHSSVLENLKNNKKFLKSEMVGNLLPLDVSILINNIKEKWKLPKILKIFRIRKETNYRGAFMLLAW